MMGLLISSGCTTLSPQTTTSMVTPSPDTQSHPTNLPWNTEISEYYDQINAFIGWFDDAENHTVIASDLNQNEEGSIGNRYYGYQVIDGIQHYTIQFTYEDSDDDQTYLTLTELTADQGWDYEVIDQKSKPYTGKSDNVTNMVGHAVISMMDYDFIDPSKITKFAMLYPVGESDPVFFTFTNDFGTHNYMVEVPIIEEFNFRRINNVVLPLPNEVWSD